MTDKEVMSFANEIRQEKYCRKYMDCHVCPLFIQMQQNRECIDSLYCNELYKKIFLDGFKAGYKKRSSLGVRLF